MELVTRTSARDVYGWGIFLGPLSDKDCYIAIETEDLKFSEGDHYFLARENTIPLTMNQLRILKWLTVSSWVGRARGRLGKKSPHCVYCKRMLFLLTDLQIGKKKSYDYTRY